MKTKVEFLTIFSIILLLLFIFLSFNNIGSRKYLAAKNGEINLVNWNFDKDKVVKLVGEWEYHYKSFLLPDSFNKSDAPEKPPLTNIRSNNRFNLRKNGYATYHLNVKIKKNTSLFALRIPVIHSSYRLWINNDLLVTKGSPGVLKRLTRAKEGPELVFFTPRSNHFQITIEAANFHNIFFGPVTAIEFGPAAYLKTMKSNDEVLDGILFGSLLIFAMLHIGMFLLTKNNKQPLYFSIFCLCIALRIVFTREHLVLNFIPFYHFELFKKVEYLTLYLSLPLLFLSIKDHCPGKVFDMVFKIVSGLCLIVILMVGVFPLSVYAYGLIFFHVIVFISIVFFFISLFFTGGYKSNEATIIMTGLFFFILSFGLEFFYTRFYFAGGHYITVGFILFTFTKSFLFIYNFARAFIHSETLSKELQMYSHDLEKKVEQRTGELREANAQKTRFFINLAHETKTPLTIIDNYLDKDIKSRGSSDSLMIVKKNVAVLKRDMFNFLDTEKLERGQVIYDHEQVVNVSDYLHNSIRQFGEVAKNHGITIDGSIQVDLHTKIDLRALDRIVNNLIDNGIKYTESGGSVSVEAYVRNDAIVLHIKDTGVGIPVEERDSVFKPYYQLNRQKRNTQGMGMGLSIVKKIIEQINGDITVQSGEQEGTVFTVMLNKYILGENDVVSDVSVGKRIDHTMDLSLDTPEHDDDKYTLLIVEDNIELLSYLVKSLSGLYNVFHAENGKDALTMLNRIPCPHLIISDVMMDEMDGFTFYEQLSGLNEFNNIPFIFLSARATREDKMRALVQGAIDYIYKPFSIEEVINKIESILGILKKHAQKRKKGLIKRLVKMLDEDDRDDVSVVDRKEKYRQCNLSKREIEIAELILKGYQNKEIGGLLSISTRTVDTHIYKIYKKAGCGNRFEFLNIFD